MDIPQIFEAGAPTNAAPETRVSEAAHLSQRAVPASDTGIFSDLDQAISTRCPSWLSGAPQVNAAYAGRLYRVVDGYLVCDTETPSHDSHVPQIGVDASATQDRDQDDIPDALDILRGAKKAAKNGAVYKNSYVELEFPGGDVPRTEGVCTDVVIRALRNAGFDLQELLQADLARRPSAYKMVKKPNPHIDHRRVRTLLPYFLHTFVQFSSDPKDSAFPYIPGDIVFMNTLGDTEPEHLGIVSDELGASGLPLIINNWTDGHRTKAMDLLGRVPVTHRFRVAARVIPQERDRGPLALLKRSGLGWNKASSLELRWQKAQQLVVVTTPLTGSSGGEMSLWTRGENAVDFEIAEVMERARVPVRVGANGLGAGRGLLNPTSEPKKQEGDKRAPAGLFELGTAFGRKNAAPYKVLRVTTAWPYRATSPLDYWVDEPEAAQYNTWQQLDPGEERPWSAEHLQMYSLGLVVEHNTGEIVKGAGSAIFIHPWKNADSPTVGCTALPEAELKRLLAWLDPNKLPLFLQLPGSIF